MLVAIFTMLRWKLAWGETKIEKGKRWRNKNFPEVIIEGLNPDLLGSDLSLEYGFIIYNNILFIFPYCLSKMYSLVTKRAI